jgi:hypothetical protein
MRPAKKFLRGSLSYLIGHSEFVQLVADFFNTRVYVNPLEQRAKPEVDQAYDNNQAFWNDALGGVQFEEMKVSLENFHLTEWIPYSPGRYFTQDAIDSRREALDFIAPNGAEYLPNGKCKVILGGIGSIRLLGKVINSTPTYFLGASSTGVSHQGIPVAMNKNQYRNVIKIIKKHGGCFVNLQGSLRKFPISLSMINYYAEIPRFCFFTESTEIVEPSSEKDVAVSVAIMFESRLGSTFSRDGYSIGLDKMWSFCTFNPSSVDNNLISAVNWLTSYATRYSGKKNPTIFNGFDEQYNHFKNPMEFPLSHVFEKIDFNPLLNPYMKHHKFTINVGITMKGSVFQNIRGSTIINDSLIIGSFNKVRGELGEDIAKALLKAAEEIEKSGNKEAADLFNGFNEELQKPNPRKTILKSLWNGIERASPTIAKLTDIVTKISKLFA